MKAAWPPSFWASAITCKVSVVLPPDSGPYTSTTRPRGNPPTPSAASLEIEPVGITFTGARTARFPRRMIEPLPYCFSICEIARSRFFVFSSVIVPPHEGDRFVPGDAGDTVYHSAPPRLSAFLRSSYHLPKKKQRYLHRVGVR